MKKLLCALVLGLVLIGGCQQGQSLPQNSITESDNGKVFSIEKNGKVTVSLKVDQSEDYFWSVSKMDGDFEVISDTRKGSRQIVVIQCGSSGVLEFTYNKFVPDGAQVLSKVSIKVVVNS